MSLTSGKIGGLDRSHRLAWIIAFGLAGSALALLFTLLEKPVYEARSSIEVAQECGNAVDNEAFLSTQTQLLQSDSLLSAAAHRAGLPETAFPKPAISREGLSHLIDIRAQNQNPQQAADFVNALVDAYIADRALRVSAAWAGVSDELRAANASLLQADKQLKEFSRRNAIPAQPRRADLVRLDPDVRSRFSDLVRDFDEHLRARDKIEVRMKAVAAPADVVRIVDRADPPELPLGRNRKLKVLAGLTLGSLLGLLSSLFERRREEPLPPPESESDHYWPSPRSFEYEYTAKDEGVNKPVELDAWQDLVDILRADPAHQLIAVASAGAVPINPGMPLILAESLIAQDTNQKVLVIDCDLTAALTSSVGLTGSHGLSDFLLTSLRRVASKDAPVRGTNKPGVFVMAAGTMPYRLPSMMSKLPARDLFTRMRSEYAFVLLAVPPVLGSSEMRDLSTVADGVILIVPIDGGEDCAEARDRIERRGGRVVGMTEEVIA